MKMDHSRGVAMVMSIVTPRAKKARAIPISDKISVVPIFLPHLRHFPFSMSHETIGRLSYHLSFVLQLRQTERRPSDLCDFEFP